MPVASRRFDLPTSRVDASAPYRSGSLRADVDRPTPRVDAGAPHRSRSLRANDYDTITSEDDSSVASSEY